MTPSGAVSDKKEKKIVISQDQLRNEEEKLEDRRTADMITAIANTIDPSIVMSSEVPSDHPELGNRLPVLDTQVSIGSDGRILYKFYEKPMASPVLLQAESAMDERTKMDILTREGVRRLLNTSLEFPKEVTDDIMSDYMQKLLNSGYNQRFRKDILKPETF